MVFAFPAYHMEKYVAQTADANLVPLAQSAAQYLGWIPHAQTRDSVAYSTRRRLLGRAERVLVKFEGEGRALVITSRCLLPTQCLDWGKNRRNVEDFLKVLQAFEQKQRA